MRKSAGEPKRSDLWLLGAFMHALKRRRTASGAIQYESISNIKSSSKMIPNWKINLPLLLLVYTLMAT
ncbi:hypothetical protein ACVXZZ_04405 [Staphylococcus aureus]